MSKDISLSPQQFEEFKTFIGDRVETEVKANYKKILDKQDILQKTVDRLYEQFNNDSNDLGHVRASVTKIEQYMKEVLTAFPKQSKQLSEHIEDKTEQVVDKAIESVSSAVPEAINDALQDFANGKSTGGVKSWRKFLTRLTLKLKKK